MALFDVKAQIFRQAHNKKIIFFEILIFHFLAIINIVFVIKQWQRLIERDLNRSVCQLRRSKFQKVVLVEKKLPY